MPQNEQRPFRELIKALEQLEHRDDGIPSVPANIQDKGVLENLHETVQSFDDYLSRPQQEDEAIFVIGFDFGTSSTKIVIQQAYADGRSIALPVPQPFRLDDHPHCWKTLLYLEEESGRFSLLNGAGKTEINNIKTTNMTGSYSVIARAETIQFTHEHAAAAYLGLLLRYAKGWLYKNAEQKIGIDLTKHNIKWELNMGLPAANLDNKMIKGRFHAILNAGWLISETDAPVTTDFVHEKFAESVKNSETFEISTQLRPEVTAETVCLIKSDSLDYKLYVLVDIGASTLDVCVFNYFDNIESRKQAMLVADVALLGVQAETWLKEVVPPGGGRFSLADLKEAIHNHIGEPITIAKTKKIPRAKICSGDETLEILLAGGGATSKIHEEAIANLMAAFARGTDVDMETKPPSVPKLLQHEAEDDEAHRLAVAWGLSVAENDFIAFSPPSTVSDIDRESFLVPKQKNEYIDKDQV